jgi:hypothetical protein
MTDTAFPTAAELARWHAQQSSDWATGVLSSWNSYCGNSPDGNLPAEMAACAIEDAANAQRHAAAAQAWAAVAALEPLPRLVAAVPNAIPPVPPGREVRA